MPDYMYFLESRLLPEQRAAMVRVGELAAEMGANVYLVGGAVRDLISGTPIRDLDFTIEGNPFRIARELEKGGAKVLSEDERLRHVELLFAGEAFGSIAAAREDIYARPGTKPEYRWATIMEDLRSRDFSLNAIAISLNPASRGLLLDPTNGLADVEKHEVRALSIHSFTNQPVRLLRIVRYAVRMGFKMEARTAEWFALAIERGLHEAIPPEDAGREVRQLAREDKPAAILKGWGAQGLLGAIHAQLPRRHPDYEALSRIARVRDDMLEAGYRPRLFAPVTRGLLGRFKAGESARALDRLGLPSAEVKAVLHLEVEAKKAVKMLGGRTTAAPRDAYSFLDKTPLDLLAFILSDSTNSKALAKIRNFLYKWKPLHRNLPSVAAELEALGLPQGPKFDAVLEQFFQLQLLGKGRNPEDRLKLLRKLAGIKPPVIKPVKEDKKKPSVPPGRKAAKKGAHAVETQAHAEAGEPAAAPTSKAERHPDRSRIKAGLRASMASAETGVGATPAPVEMGKKGSGKGSLPKAGAKKPKPRTKSRKGHK